MPALPGALHFCLLPFAFAFCLLISIELAHLRVLGLCVVHFPLVVASPASNWWLIIIESPSPSTLLEVQNDNQDESSEIPRICGRIYRCIYHSSKTRSRWVRLRRSER